jgi:hypothetical protein
VDILHAISQLAKPPLSCVGWRVWAGVCGLACVGWRVWAGVCYVWAGVRAGKRVLG